MKKDEIQAIQSFINATKTQQSVVMSPKTIGAIVKMIYEVWEKICKDK